MFLVESTLSQEASTANALTIRVANSVFVGSVAFVVLCNVSSEANFVVQVSLKQPPAAHAWKRNLALERPAGETRGGLGGTTTMPPAAHASSSRCRLRARAQSMILSMNFCWRGRSIAP